MVFSSITFVSVFFPVVFLLHWILPNIRIKNALLILASLMFYAYGEPVYVLLMLASVFVNYLLGMACARVNERKIWMLIAVIWNIGLLVVFKYTGFLIETLNATGLCNVPVPQIELPIGISFFTFQAMSYVIDVYRDAVKPQKNFFKVLLYVSFFPQLIAGPIVKYHDMEEEIDNRSVTLDGVAYGMRRFIAGLSKKVLISNVLALTADGLFAAEPGSINILTAWIAAIAYLFQIYFDFSGYSDMALGMGQMFGFHFKENFHYPYISDSIREFWRRWHMSLSGWFKEYLYIPLGGNRKGRARTILNKFIVFFCTGFWHGANVTFIVWGLYHGVFQMLEAVFPKREKQSKILSVLKHVYTMIVVTVGFVIFRADTMSQALYFIREMFTGFHFESIAVSLAVQQMTPLFIIVIIAAVIGSCPVKTWLEKKKGYEPLAWICSLAGLVLCMLSLSGNTYNPFIYFRF